MSCLTEYNEAEERRRYMAKAEARGIELNLISLVMKKLQKGKDVKQIADELEETVERIGEIIDAVEACDADADAHAVYEQMKFVTAGA